MFLSQKKAQLMLRREAGFSVARAREAVAGLKKYPDGKRQKVKRADVIGLVEEAAIPSAKPAATIAVSAFRRNHESRRISVGN